MSKKRVHEIAKELKSYGIELDNKEVVTELVSLGYDVKSHSSSLEDDQATAAVLKIAEKRKPKAAPAPVAAKGFVVRRKPAAEEAPPPEPVAPPPPPPEPELVEEIEPIAAAAEHVEERPAPVAAPPPARVEVPAPVARPIAATSPRTEIAAPLLNKPAPRVEA